jgi:pectate lyase
MKKNLSHVLSLALLLAFVGCEEIVEDLLPPPSENPEVPSPVEPEPDPSEPEPPQDPLPPEDPELPLACKQSELFEEREGFAHNVTGGAQSQIVWVTNLNDSGSGSLRAALSGNAARRVQFRVSGRVNLRSPINVGSNKTIDGRGANVTISGWGLYINRVSNVIVTGLTFDTGKDDAIQIKDSSSRIWVHRNTFRNFEDGLIDITRASTDVTVSWNRFENHDKTMLISADPSHGNGDKNIRVTVHHNYFNQTRQRHPRVRFGKVHVYNNYFYRLNSYGVGASLDSEVVVENNIFESDRNRDAVVTKVGDDPRHGSVRADGNWLLNGARITERNRSSVFDPERFYQAKSMQRADAHLRSFLVDCAGNPALWK